MVGHFAIILGAKKLFPKESSVLALGINILIIPRAESSDARTRYQTAQILFEEQKELQEGLSDSKRLLSEGASCTAVDMLLRVTIKPPQGKRAKMLFDEAIKLQKDSMVLCFNKMVEKGDYQRARAILQPYAGENERFQKELEKITERQNREMAEKASQKKETMEDIKKEDRRWSIIGIAASVLSGLLLLCGVGASLLGQLSTAIVSSLSSVVPGYVVLLYYNRSDKIRSERLKLIEKTTGEEQLDLDVVRKATGLFSTNEQSGGEKE